MKNGRRKKGEGRRKTAFRLPSSFFLLPILWGCQLTETIVSTGERTLVVQFVVDRTQAQQFAVIEESSIGDTAASGGSSVLSPTNGRPRFPVVGATVQVEHLEGGACPGLVETLAEVPPTAPAVLPTGRYAGALTCLGPGERLAMRVTTAGRVVTGETVIPGATNRSVWTGSHHARFPMDTVLFNRESDTLRLSLDAPPGGGMHVEARRFEDHDQVAAIFLNDSLGVAFPGNLINPFEGDSGATSFRAGAYYLLAVAVGDSNYFDYARTFSDPITGRGFLNYLKGGMGVFGSIETELYLLRVVASVNDPREGTYRISGRLGNNPNTNVFDVTFEPYVDDYSGNQFSAFVSGTVQNSPANVSGDGIWSVINPNGFAYSFIVRRSNPPFFRLYTIQGVRSSDGSPFSLSIRATRQDGSLASSGTLTAVQLTGPATP